MYLGIDLGTSGIKGVLLNDEKNIISSANVPLEISRRQRGWAEQQPQSWINATIDLFTKLKAQNNDAFKNIKSIGIAGQMHGATVLDDKGDVLYPCILWNDTRSFKEAKLLDEHPLFRKVTGNIVFPGFTAPKILWLKNNEKDIFNKISKILLPKDYLRWWMTGDYVSDVSDASGTCWLDVEKREWSQDLINKSGIKLNQLPLLVEGNQITGRMKSALLKKFGFSHQVNLVGGAGDNASSACGVGAIDAGDGLISLGTSGVILSAQNNFLPNTDNAVHTFCHALPDSWIQMGVILSATDSLNWYSNLMDKSIPELLNPLGDSISDSTGVSFLPYLSGERTPHNDASVRAAFIGMGHSTNRLSLTQSVLEGICYAYKDTYNALISSGTNINSLIAIGGGAKSNYWLEMLATILDKEIMIPQDGEYGASFGAALLSYSADNQQQHINDIFKKPRIKNTIEPVLEKQNSYLDSYETFRSYYPCISK